MLDINKLYSQIAALGAYQKNRTQSLAASLNIAEKQIKLVADDNDAFTSKVMRATTSWLVAKPTSEKPFDTYPTVECPESYIILSADGSQINPDRHGIHSAFLINIGRVQIGYGDFLGYKFGSTPSLFFEEKDVLRRFGGEQREVTGPVLAALRQKMEAEELSGMIDQYTDKPSVALVDGTLILWSLETNPERLMRLGTDDLKKQSFVSFMQLISGSKHANTPVAGYISSPGSSDVVNMLKINLCPSETVDCDKCPYKIPGFDEAPPCAKISAVTDGMLFRRLLQHGERSSLFESASQILQAYGEESVFFFYINAGKEIARIEIPGWVARDKGAVDLVHTVCLDQANKGNGYPIAVAEAHEQAVVKSADKNLFDQLVLKALIKQGSSVTGSRKALRKRGGFI